MLHDVTDIPYVPTFGCSTATAAAAIAAAAAGGGAAVAAAAAAANAAAALTSDCASCIIARRPVRLSRPSAVVCSQL